MLAGDSVTGRQYHGPPHDPPEGDLMPIRHGRELLAMPGPTTIPDAVLGAMHRPAIDIYAGELLEVTARCLDTLRTVFGTAHRTYIYAANGHGAWEAALTNVLSRGDRVLVLESGVFAPAWGRLGAVLGIDVHHLRGDYREAVDPERLEAHLREDAQGTIKAVLVVQVDTASGVVNDVAAIRRAMDAAGHGAVLMVDTIASLATMPFEMDDWGVDVAVAGSQKGLMMPPGLSFCAAGPRARAAHANANLRTHYWDWTAREGDEHYQKYCGTAPEHLLFGLSKALELLLEEGLSAVYRRHRLLAGAVRAAVSVWARGGALEFNVLDPAQRADSVTTIRTVDGLSPDLIVDFCRDVCGVVLGVGIGELSGRAFRIAHMGHVNAPMVLGTLASVDLALKSHRIEHGHGALEAAVDALAGQLAPVAA